MFCPDEIDAIILGSDWVNRHGDPALARAARRALAKFASLDPGRLRDAVDDPVVGTPPVRSGYQDSAADVGQLRAWSRLGRKLVVHYIDRAGVQSERTVWPFLVAFGPTSRMLFAWCELRRDFRMFRTDRLIAVEFLDQRYPDNRSLLRHRWLTAMEENHADPDRT